MIWLVFSAIGGLLFGAVVAVSLTVLGIKKKITQKSVTNYSGTVGEEQKQEAIDNMIAITDIAEKETAAEILLESKGFDDVVVSITDGTVDVVVNAAELTEAQRAQIQDIVIRKTGVAADAIVISTLSAE